MYNHNIRMSFNKFGKMVAMNGSIIRTEEVSPPAGNIADIQDSSKYLRILQANGNPKKAVRKLVKTSREARQVLRSQLTGKNKAWI